jgi:hypothetical protein
MAPSGKSMENREEVRPVLEAQVRRWSHIPWEQIVSLLRDPHAYQATFQTKKYQVEVELLENTEAHIRLSVAVDDGALPRSMLPLTQSIVLSKTTWHERRRVAR